MLLIATVLLVALVVVTLLRWIAHLAAFGRMSDVIDRVEDAARSAMMTFAKKIPMAEGDRRYQSRPTHDRSYPIRSAM